MCSTPSVANHPAQEETSLAHVGRRVPGSWAGSQGCPSLPTCLCSLPGAAAGGCQPGVPRLPWRCQTQALKWCPKGNLPMNWNTCQVKKNEKQNNESIRHVDKTLIIKASSYKLHINPPALKSWVPIISHPFSSVQSLSRVRLFELSIKT